MAASRRIRKTQSDPDADSRAESVFPIVGVGASAGGLDAFRQFLSALPLDTGMGFVLVQHLSPSHPSALAEILARATSLPVTVVSDEPRVEPDHVYVIPADRDMTLQDGHLQLQPRETHSRHYPVDRFFRSLAQDRRSRAVGIVLSGTGSDGTVGLEEIKAEGGITFAQDRSAEHSGMPDSAIASGCVDFVLAPGEIARELARLSHHRFSLPSDEDGEKDAGPHLAEIAKLIRHATGVDFTGYKFNTIYRRVMRRMAFRKIDSLPQYVEFVRENRGEVQALHQDILISVTRFFRDPDAYTALRKTVFPRLLQGRSHRQPIRIWTLGCSTGQEAYSLAMTFVEAAEAVGNSIPFQLFASDLSAHSIAKARAGVYPQDIAQDVSPERLRRFFTQTDGVYRVAKSIRDACVFSHHNVLADPPFSRMDFISCRNLLIYMEPVLQQRVLPTLHYALNAGGYLWLGGSEAIGAYRSLFDIEDTKHKIFVKRPGTSVAPSRAHSNPPPLSADIAPLSMRTRESIDLPREADRLLLNRFAPPGVLVTANLDILQYRGDTSPFLAPNAGTASLNLLKMLRDGLLVGVRSAALRASKEKTTIREDGLRVRADDGFREVSIEVIPVGKPSSPEESFLILFHELRGDPPDRARKAPAPKSRKQESERLGTAEQEIGRLTQELDATRDYLESLIEQQEAANEELQSANEEVQSANEELQSTNEELETSKEEIQSSNEELSTVNEELAHRNVELQQLNDDLVNLLASVHVAIVILGPDLRVRRYTPKAEMQFGLGPKDLGRTFANIDLELQDAPDLAQQLAEVIDEVAVREFEVRDRNGHWFSLRLRPYKTLDHKIDGAVVMLVDIDVMKRAHERIRESESHYRAIFDATSVGVCEIDGVTTNVLRVNDRMARMTGYRPHELIGKPLLEITHAEDTDRDRDQYARLLSGEVARRDDEKQIVRKDGSVFWAQMTINLIRDSEGRPVRGVAIVVDISDRKLIEQRVLEASSRIEAVFDESPIGMYVVDDGLRIRHVNALGRATFAGSDALIGRELGPVLEAAWPPAIADRIMERFRRTLATGEPFTEHEFDAVRRDTGQRELYDWQLQRVHLPTGGHGVVCCFIDTAERVRLRESAANSSEANRRKNEFLAMLAHELRNPLAPILNSLNVLKRTSAEDPTVANATTMMERQLGHMVRLVDELLDVSRISRGKIELRTERVDLGRTVEQVVDAWRGSIERSGKEFVAEFPPEPIVLIADPVRLSQIVGNLLSNASKFTRPGSKIRLSILREDGEALIRVRDDGIGIPADRLTQVFEMFVQLDTSLERTQGGLGIGLSLVKTLVEMHGGSVAVSSEGTGKGCEFAVRLPIQDRVDARDAAPPIARDVAVHLGRRRILVVDDNHDSADSLAMLLRVSGHDSRTANDGLAAIEAATLFRPEVILLDIGMPRLNGYDVARRIRGKSWGKSIVLVALTGWGQEEDRRKSKEAGFDGHTVKPVDYASLMQLLRELLTDGRPSAV